MSSDPDLDRLNGVATGDTPLTTNTGQTIVIKDNQILPWRPVTHYRKVTDSRDRNVTRNSGSYGAAGLGGPAAGLPWDTPSTLDHATVGAEIWNVLYVDPAGKDWTGMDILIEMFKALQKNQATPAAS